MKITEEMLSHIKIGDYFHAIEWGNEAVWRVYELNSIRLQRINIVNNEWVETKFKHETLQPGQNHWTKINNQDLEVWWENILAEKPIVQENNRVYSKLVYFE